MIEVLAPIFHGAWAPYGEGVRQSAPPADAVAIGELVERPDAWRTILERQCVAHRCADRRPVASAWSMRYLARLLPPALAAATLLQRCLPLAVGRMSVCLDEQGGVDVFHVEGAGREVVGAPTQARYGELVDAHLVPLFAALSRAARLPEKILWSNAARRMEILFDEALSQVAADAPVAADRACLLDSADWSGRPNPLHKPRREVAGIRLHRDCCLSYRLPEEAWHCAACPLARRGRSDD